MCGAVLKNLAIASRVQVHCSCGCVVRMCCEDVL